MAGPQDANQFEALADAPFLENRPTAETAAMLEDELLFQRATQTYLWALPLINTLGMKVGSERAFGAGYNVLPIWKKRLDAKTLVTTPNSDVIYAMSYIDLGKDGPLVFEAPPKLQGILLDFWQRPIPVDGGKFFGDVGFFGPDEGNGGKFLLLPPDYKGPVAAGLFRLSIRYQQRLRFSAVLLSGSKKLTPAVDLVERTKIYPLNSETGAKPMTFPDASGVPVNMLPISDGSAFDWLKTLLDGEGTHLAGSDGLGMLATLALSRVNRSRPTNVHAHPRSGREDRLQNEPRRRLRTECQRAIVFHLPGPPWMNPIADGTPENRAQHGRPRLRQNGCGSTVDLDARDWFFTNYYSISPGMVSKFPARAQLHDRFRRQRRRPLSGGSNYRLTCRANIPAANFWSLTLYEAENASGLANGQPFPSLGSRDEAGAERGRKHRPLSRSAVPLQERDATGSPRFPGRGFFAILRLYGPTEDALNRSWKPGDIERAR